MSRRGILFSLSTLTLGCSEVLVEPDGAGGRPNEFATASSGSSTSAEATSSTGFDTALQDQFCAAVGQCLPSCAGAFRNFQDPPCGAQGLALIGCMIERYSASTCSLAECDEEKADLIACRSNTSVECAFGHHSGNGNTCTAAVDCPDGRHQALCSNATPGSPATCDCFLDTLFMGSCTAEDYETCSLKEGCCASILGSCSNCVL